MPSETSHKPSMRIVESPTSDSTHPRDEDVDMELTVCERCNGTGVEVVFGKGARPCGCRAQDSRRTFLDAARIPKRYAGCTLESFKCAPNTTQDKALQHARFVV